MIRQAIEMWRRLEPVELLAVGAFVFVLLLITGAL
jgi:hypothetical protein